MNKNRQYHLQKFEKQYIPIVHKPQNVSSSTGLLSCRSLSIMEFQLCLSVTEVYCNVSLRVYKKQIKNKDQTEEAEGSLVSLKTQLQTQLKNKIENDTSGSLLWCRRKVVLIGPDQTAGNIIFCLCSRNMCMNFDIRCHKFSPP